MAEKDRLLSLKERLTKSEDETTRLKEAIAKEEKRLREKEKRENEKYWRDLSKKMESILITELGVEYKTLINPESLLDILKQGISPLKNQNKENDIDICKYTGGTEEN